MKNFKYVKKKKIKDLRDKIRICKLTFFFLFWGGVAIEMRSYKV